MTHPTVSLRAELGEHEDLRAWGHAPGSYVFKCQDCPPDLGIYEKMGRLGDKRSWRCEEHALAAKASALAQPASPTEATEARADYSGHVPNRYVPDLPAGCALFAVNPDTEAWHYVNHAGTWQGMPNPLAPTEATAPHDGLRA